MTNLHDSKNVPFSAAWRIHMGCPSEARIAIFGNGAQPGSLMFIEPCLIDGRDLRNDPWARRRALLVQLLAEADTGIRLNEHIEDVDGAVVFGHGVRDGAGGHCREASRQSLPLGTLPGMD